MSRLDIVVDLETLGVGIKPVILQIGAVAFDLETGNVIRKFELKIDMESCVKSGLDIDVQTLKWWLEQDSRLSKEVFSGEYNIKKALIAFSDWIKAIQTVEGASHAETYLWGNGILADNAWLKGAYETNKLHYPIKYTNDRDIRTLLELAAFVIDDSKSNITSRIKTEGTKHNALDDALWEVKLISTCYNIILQ